MREKQILGPRNPPGHLSVKTGKSTYDFEYNIAGLL